MRRALFITAVTSSLLLLSGCAVAGHSGVQESDYFKITRAQWLSSVDDSTLRNDAAEVCNALSASDGSGWDQAIAVAQRHGIEASGAAGGFVALATATYCPEKTNQLHQVISW